MLKSYLKLIRAPGLFSIASNILASLTLLSLLSIEVTLNLSDYLLLVLISLSWYQFGMITNDIADYKEDSEERPFRPLPSQAISMSTAKGFALVWAGISLVLSCLISLDFILYNLILGSVIISYNFLTKGRFFGPMNMGLVRTLNWCLVLAYFHTYQTVVVYLAVLVGFYTAIVTLISHYETNKLPAKIRVLASSLFICAAILALAISQVVDISFVQTLPLVAFFGYFAVYTYKFSSEESPQLLVMLLLKSMVLLDAIVLLVFLQWQLALVTASLLLLSSLLAKRIYLT